MSQIVVPDAGERYLLQVMLKGNATATNLILRLFKNNHTIAPASVIGDLTEADFDGYENVGMSPPGWTDPTTVGGRAKSVFSSAAQQFTNGGTESQTIYGYYVTNESNSLLVWGENFDTPMTIDPAGQLQVWPEITAKSEY